MEGIEQQIRNYYASENKTDNEELLKMILLDGCFMFCIIYGTEGAAQ